MRSCAWRINLYPAAPLRLATILRAQHRRSRRGFTLFAGARDANRFLDYPSPRLWSLYSGLQSLEKRVDSKRQRIAIWPLMATPSGNEPGLDIAPERDHKLAGQGDQHDAPDPT